jgi:hypothetical protein
MQISYGFQNCFDLILGLCYKLSKIEERYRKISKEKTPTLLFFS